MFASIYFSKIFSLSLLGKLTISVEFILMDPESGPKRPIIFFKRTDFPEPDAPIMAKDSPSRRLKLMFSNITLLPNVLFKFLDVLKHL